MDNGRPPRLEDLYTVGTHQLRNEDGSTGRPVPFKVGELEVAVHVVKVNDKDQQSIDRRAAAAKAVYLSAFADKTSDEYLSQRLWVMDETDELELIAFLAAQELRTPAIELEARQRSSTKWTETHDYEALEDAWYGDIENGELGLMYLWNNQPEQSDDPVEQAENDARVLEAQRVWELINEFHQELEAALAEKKDEIAESYLSEESETGCAYTTEELQDMVVQLAGRTQADTIFFTEKLRQRLYYSVRQADDWRKRYFGTVTEIDSLPPEVTAVLHQTYDAISVPDQAGKGSPGTPGSSPSSAPSAEAAPSPPSGPEAATPSKTSPTSS